MQRPFTQQVPNPGLIQACWRGAVGPLAQQTVSETEIVLTGVESTHTAQKTFLMSMGSTCFKIPSS